MSATHPLVATHKTPSSKERSIVSALSVASLGVGTDGNWLFYGWMTLLTAIALVGANAWAVQVRDGMIVTNMSDRRAGVCTSPIYLWRGWPLVAS